jgi:hypothetical protein
VAFEHGEKESRAMTDNTKIWDKLGKTDPKHTKTFKRAGGFEGTAIKPMFSYRRMTEEFGPCGVGWGVGEPVFQVVPGDNREVLVYCTASIWYTEGGKVATVHGVGGDKVVTHIKANEKYKRPERWENDDEAFKKAFTDAVTNALKLIGVGADVHMGMFDDNKYVNTMQKEFSEADNPENDAPKKSSASLKRDGAWEELKSELDNELLDATTLPRIAKLRADYREKARDKGWPKSWLEALKDVFDGREDEINASQSTLMAGE